MKQKVIGVYSLGSEYCELVGREGKGGEFYFQPEEKHIPRIKIGLDYDNWEDIVSILLHETFEFCLARIKGRFVPEDDFGKDVHSYFFMFSHPDFSDVCGRVSMFLVEALPDLAKVWKEW